MYCKKCGNAIVDGELFCSACGARVEAEQPKADFGAPGSFDGYGQPQTETVIPGPYIADGEAKSRSSLVMGILSICLCWALGVPGIILGALAISNGKQARCILNESHYFFYNALAGIITGAIGLGTSIFFTVYWFIVICLIAAL